LASRNAGEVSRLQVETVLSRVLLEKVRRDDHPSFTQMNILEQTLPKSLQREYLTILLEKVIGDQWPSVSMLRRIQRVAAGL
jgi:hypothetical protein